MKFLCSDSIKYRFRFLVDDAALYISDKCDADAVDLRKSKSQIVLSGWHVAAKSERTF